MTDKKISALTAATTPLAGTEVFPIVQSATTVKATIANVQAAPVTAGTANGVQYLNASKVPTTVIGLQFDGANLGIGQYPSNAGGITTNIELPYGATIASRSNTAAPQLYIMSNAVGTGYAPTYAINGYATQYTTQGFGGTHSWATAPSGVAGAAISFEDRLNITQLGDIGVNTGNIVPGTAAKGINFTANTPAAGMTSQLLNWYEEGAWTPSQGGGLTVVGAFSSAGTYTRVGRLVTVQGYVLGATSVAISAASDMCGNLPFSPSSANDYQGSVCNSSLNTSGACSVSGGNGLIYSTVTFAATGAIKFTVTYMT